LNLAPTGAFCNIVVIVISPLLANIALHGLENHLKSLCPTATIVRYADDFVILALALTSENNHVAEILDMGVGMIN